ncbi:MAG: AAA family ATPase, partial [Gammaproteobacteria bacterium]|nr:AAA family ATPase [Gammaproteobacteria bacterium]
MWIRALSVKHFAGIRSADLEFVNGLNVLHGPNEIGKSTLVTAIRAVLLLQDGATAAESFKDWYIDQPPQANLTFEVEPQRIWRIRKSFGKGADGSSYLEFSRDGTDFTQEAKGREVDGKVRDTLQWGLDRPGGKGKKKGFGESFLSTTLLAEQDAVKEVLKRRLDDDPDESGKQHLVDALQALAQDPDFTRVLAATQEKVNEAYTSTGQKSRRRGSPWMELRTLRQAAEKRRADIGSQARSSEGARQRVEELRDALNKAQSYLDDRERHRADLE